jgi:UDP-N-acetylmuramoylalanine--D-glutamate ligase
MNKKQKIAILGAGESGVGTALLAQAKGFDVFVSDKGHIKDTYKKTLVENQIDFEELQHTASKILDADMVMKSPGIPDKVPLVKELRDNHTPVISEIEFASEYTNATCVAITGSNGKTTTARLTHYILEKELEVGLGGNIGDSFALQVLLKDAHN